MPNEGGGLRLATTAEVATAAMTAMAHVLHEARCLVEPAPEVPELTVEDAAKLLCALSQWVKLNDPEEDFVVLLERRDMVDAAFRHAQAAGMDPQELSQALAARRLLQAHHRN